MAEIPLAEMGRLVRGVDDLVGAVLSGSDKADEIIASLEPVAKPPGAATDEELGDLLITIHEVLGRLRRGEVQPNAVLAALGKLRNPTPHEQPQKAVVASKPAHEPLDKRITLTPGMSATMLAKWADCTWNPATLDHFPLDPAAAGAELDVCLLITRKGELISDAVQRLGVTPEFAPARIEHLLTFAALYPGLYQECFLFAPGSVSGSECAYLSNSKPRRVLGRWTMSHGLPDSAIVLGVAPPRT